MPRGRYIVVEGGDGAGKGTQVKLLLERLRDYGIDPHYIREPGGDPDGEAIRKVVLNPDGQLLPRAKVLLFNAARIQTSTVIQEHLDNGVWCIADRSFVSTLAYQCYGEGLPLGEVETICQFATRQLEPNLVVVLHAPFEIVSQRRRYRATTDWFEEQGEEFHRRVIGGYMELAVRRGIPWIDASGTPPEVFERIWAHVKPLISSTK